jgi:predicted DNA-binding transcriptional regulator YafY
MRSQETIRQWQILRALAASRLGLTVDDLAAGRRVTSRTIRRDLKALEEAGFPVYPDKAEGPTRWKLEPAALKALGAGFTLIELCALYFSRAALECLSAAPLQQELASAFTRFEAALTPAMRQFLDRLPAVVGAKRSPGAARIDRAQRRRVGQLLDASLHHRQVRMRYHSAARARTKDYDVDPYRVVCAEGALYLQAYVPEYGEVRTFALSRIERLAVLDRRFTARDGPLEMFPHSLGVFSGTPVRVEIEFDPAVAAHVAAREWHASQTVQGVPGGAIRLEMHVCIDDALRRWILGFGSHARVIAPFTLAEDILGELGAAGEQYAPALDLQPPPDAWIPDDQRPLPFGSANTRALLVNG